MLENYFISGLLALISFFPIVIWAYIFSYIDDNPINRKRFFLGVTGGILSVVPILYMDRLFDFLGAPFLNIFYFASQVSGFFSSMQLGVSLGFFLFFLALFSLALGVFTHKFRNVFWVYIKNFFVFLCFVFFLGLFVYGINIGLSNIDFMIPNEIIFGDIVFNSFRLVIFYYLLVAFIEEASKHFNFLQSSILYIDSVKTGVLYAIFIALGFSFIENILYLYSYYTQYAFGSETLKLYFFRSTFSVMVHVLCSSVLAYYFSKAFIAYREKDLSFAYIRIFFKGLILSILLHLIFDITLTLGFSFIIFLYFIGGYLYVSSIFYRE